MSSWRDYRRALVVVSLGALAALTSVAAGDGIGLLDGLLYDVSLAIADRRPGDSKEPVAAIALDAESLDSDELAALPRVFLTPVWGRVVNELTDAGARSIGFDIIFSYAANRFPGGDSQYDRDFLAAASRARDKLVLARSARAYPALPFVGAVFNPRTDVGKPEPAAIGYAELTPDIDGVFRHAAPIVHNIEGRSLRTFSAAMLDRAGASAMTEEVLLAPRRALEAIPTYRLIDLLRCREPKAWQELFSGKLVLIGTTLPEEDRKRSPDRFMATAQPRALDVAGCKFVRLGASAPDSGTVPGLFIHAAAMEAVLNGNLIRTMPQSGRTAAAASMAVGGGLLGFALAPVAGALAVVALVALCLATVPILIGFGIWFPAVLPGAAAVVSMAVAYVVRFLIEDRRRRRVQQAFGHYLAPVIVDQLAEDATPLRLGGEEREVTVMFADLSGFTALSGKVGPTELMTVTNAYLAIIVGAVEQTGGYVDKFIGDAVMAVWGAPAPDPTHARSAAQAALAAVGAVMQAKRDANAAGRPGYSVKIGLNSGPAVVGNVGAENRYNYTAVGETVNIAARLESVPGDYACQIVVGPATAAAINDDFVLNELDWVKVKGKEQPLTVYELVAERSAGDAARLAYVQQYRAALELYRAGAFLEAEIAWRGLTHPTLPGTAPPAVMADRAMELQRDPPPHWDGVFVKTTK